jgi:hypothetical protein
MNTTGSIRSLSQSKELIGGFDESKYASSTDGKTLTYKKDDGEEIEWNMNRRFNYDVSNLP